jgi:hypothetical protein
VLRHTKCASRDRAARRSCRRKVCPLRRYASTVQLEPGDYSIQVTNTNDTRFTGSFEAVPREALPRAPGADTVGALASPLAVAVQAAWLAMQEGGIWRHEAYLQLLETSYSSNAARLLAEALATGAQVL